MKLPFRLTAGALTLALFALGACGDDPVDPPDVPDPPLGLQVTPLSTTGLQIRFNGRAADDDYTIERAEASGGTFTTVTTIDAPATDGQLMYDDTVLEIETAYKYRVKANRGGQSSNYTSEITGTTNPPGLFTRSVTGDITTNTTWYRDTVYTLSGFIHVGNGATLTIESGTRIVGDFNTLGSSLFVLRGAKIMAIGTADLPIVFTSSQAAGTRQAGDWGGLILVGNAVDNRTGVEVEIEGTNTDAGTTPGTNYRIVYNGGTTNTDNSGELRYVRVEFAGYAPSVNNELNSFSFAAVGSGTRLSYLEALAGLDDSFEFWGGAVDGTYLVSYEAGDDHFDMSEGYHGRLQYLIALQSFRLTPRTGAGSPSSDPQGIENDGCDGAGCTNGRNTVPYTTPVVANFTLVGTNDAATSGSSGGYGMMLRRGTGGYYVNGVVARWPRGSISLRDAETFLRAANAATPDMATTDLAVSNILMLESPLAFQAGAGQNAFDLGGNALVLDAAATVSDIFTAFPASITAATTEAEFDWTPKAASAAASGGLAAFTGKLATAAGSVVTGASFRGAVNPAGPKWFQSWTYYRQN
ncbi:MAG TPA: fibronectin type III domain-containing protein [Gemmatimonadaceae bacterium]